MQKFQVSERENGTSLEKYVRKVLNVAPLSFIYRLFRKKDVKVNGRWEDRKYVVSASDEIAIYITDEQFEEFKKNKSYSPNDALKELIIYEDNQIILVNKPRGVLVQKDGKETGKSLDQMVVEYLMSQDINFLTEENAFMPGPAHRLDRNTSGIVAFGKTHDALQQLFTLFKERDAIGKHYVALVKGRVEKNGTIEAPLLKDSESNTVKVTSVSKGAKNAKTIYKVIETIDEYSLLDLTIVTGRTHQIRVHLAYIGHPVIGDSKYGDFKENVYFEKEFGFKNQFLHASEMHFGHLSEPLEHLSSRMFTAPMPEEFKTLIIKLKEKKINDHQ